MSDLQKKLPQNHAEITQAILAENTALLKEFLAGLDTYSHTGGKKWRSKSEVIWQKGNARLLEFSDKWQVASGKKNKSLATGHRPLATVVVIPSLINRWHIVDLDEKLSFIQFLLQNNIRPLVLDWDIPGELEKNLDTAGYIEQILLPAIDIVRKEAKENLFLLGYCMGGSFAVAAAQLMQEHLKGLILFASPWDFHAKDFPRIPLTPENAEFVRKSILSADIMPAFMVQYMFYLQDPFLFQKKFARFGASTSGDERNLFIAVEEWANDGVDLSAKVAAECLVDWVDGNMLMNGKWKVAGEKIDPAKIKLPSFVAIPKKDKIVPPLTAMPLAEKLPNATLLRPDCGHVGLTASRKAPALTWKPLLEWIAEI